MDLFNVSALEVTNLAMDGLLERQTAIASNTANAMTPDYQRKRCCIPLPDWWGA